MTQVLIFKHMNRKMTQVLKEKMTHVEKYKKESGPGFSNMYIFYYYNIEYEKR